jgi:hypothetical protein
VIDVVHRPGGEVIEDHHLVAPLQDGDRGWLEPVPAVLAFVKSTQNRTSAVAGLRGGIKGSWPLDGDYGRYEVLNWATKYFVDALIRHQRIGGPVEPGWGERNRLA